MGDPPSDAGVQLMVAVAFPATAVMFVGGEGAFSPPDGVRLTTFETAPGIFREL